MAGTGVGKFSSTAGNNTGNMTVNFAENMAPSNVNNAARELMGHIYDMYKQIGDGYFEFGDGDATYTVARSDADTITITSSSDISSVYFPGRKIRITDGGANVVEGTIASSSHSSTTQTVNLTGISLASGTPTKVELGIDTAAFGGRIILDDDGDSYIEAVTDDTIDFYAGGTKIGTFTATTVGFNDGVTIATGDNSDTLTLKSTDDDAGAGPVLNMVRDSASPADGDGIARIYFTADNDAGEPENFVRIKASIIDASNGSEDGQLRISRMIGGGDQNVLSFLNTETVVNDDSKDLDFRVESDGNTHALFVDGGNNHVNIGTSTAYAGKLNIETTDNSFNLFLVSTDADANAGPNMKFYRNSGSPADNDIMGNIHFTGRNDNSQDVDYAHIETLATDVSDGAEDGYMNIYVAHAGTKARSRIEMDSAEMVINEGGVDLDFRVESDGNTHMLFVDGGNDHVNIGTSSDLGATFNVKAPNNTTTQQLVLTDNDNQTKTHIGNFSNTTYITNNTHYNGSSWVKDDNAVGTAFIGAGDGSVNFGTSTDATPTVRMTIDATGAVTKPAQPAFLAQPSGSQNNLSNSDSVAFASERFDQNGDFASSTFTAPVTGKYQLNLNVRLQSLDTDANYHMFQLETSNRNYQWMVTPSGLSSDATYWFAAINVLADMDANDTADVHYYQSGGADQADIEEGGTSFSGFLAC